MGCAQAVVLEYNVWLGVGAQSRGALGGDSDIASAQDETDPVRRGWL